MWSREEFRFLDDECVSTKLRVAANHVCFHLVTQFYRFLDIDEKTPHGKYFSTLSGILIDGIYTVEYERT